LKDVDHNTRIEELKLYQHEKIDPARPDFPVKKVLDVKPSSKTMPVKPKTNTPTSRKRVTA
jgi:hypothetical protein